MTSRVSGYKFFSMGIVVTTKPEGTDEIEVSPIEEFSFVNGLLKETNTNTNIDLPDHKGVNRQDKMEGKKTLIAKWAPFSEGNRLTSPDVYANETVMILRFADTQEYYWVTMMREPTLRRKETVLYAFSNLEKGMEAFDKDTSYWMEWDTRRQKVTLHTANNDGEPFKFDFVIDAGQGNVSVRDDVGNFIVMDSKNDLLSLTSVAGANIDLDKGHIKGKGITINLEADESMVLKAGSSVLIDAGTSMTLKAETTMDISAGAGVKIGAPSVAIAAGSSTMDMEGGSVTIKGNTKQEGDYTTEGNVRMNGGNIIMTGSTITANGEDLTIDKT